MKFEYRVIKRQWPITGDEMNDWGDRGWELAGIASQAYASGITEFIYYFKREKKNV